MAFAYPHPRSMTQHGLWVALSVALLTLSAKVSLPIGEVPMTLQVAAVLLIAGWGGFQIGWQSLAAYLAAGAAGLPVFAGTPAAGVGLAYMAGPTGGYLLGFLLAAAIVGWISDHFSSTWALLPAMGVALAVIYGCGLAHLSAFVPGDALLAKGVAPFFLGDLCKLALAFCLCLRLRPNSRTNSETNRSAD